MNLPESTPVRLLQAPVGEPAPVQSKADKKLGRIGHEENATRMGVGRKRVFVFSETQGLYEMQADCQGRKSSHAPRDDAAFAGSLKRKGKPDAAQSASQVGKDGPELFLPEVLLSLVTPPQRQHEATPCTLAAAAIGVLSVAVGNGAVIKDERLFSAPVNASLAFALVGDPDGSSQVVSSCSQALAEVQDTRLADLTEKGVQGIETQIEDLRRERESYFGKANYRSPRIEANYEAQIQALRRRLRPLLRLRNPRAGTLPQAASTSGGGGLLVTYSRDESVYFLLDGSPRSCRDLELLNAAWRNETPDPIRIDPRHLPVVRPVVTVCLLCSNSTVIRIVCSEEPLVRELAERMVFLNVARATPNPRKAPTPVSLPQAFRETVSRLIAARDSAPQRLLKLSRRAATALLHFARETERYRQERGRWFGEPVMLAAKIALINHLCSKQLENQISVLTMRQAIALARRFTELSMKVVQNLVSDGEQEAHALQRQADVMLEKIKTLGPPVSKTVLLDACGSSHEELDQRALELLLRSGLVQLEADGRLNLGPPTGVKTS